MLLQLQRWLMFNSI